MANDGHYMLNEYGATAYWTKKQPYYGLLLLNKMDYHCLKIIKKLLQTNETTNCYYLKYRYFSRHHDK